MLDEYQNFLKEFDAILESLRTNQQKYLKCKKGCSMCCEQGEYPFSQLEFAYLTQGYLSLDEKTRAIVQQNIKELKENKKKNKKKTFEHQCPFLINGACCVYEYRGIICRTFGVCYYDEEREYVRVPGCVHFGLNYSEYFDEKTQTLNIEDVPRVNLRIDKILRSHLAKKYSLESGEIRPMADWFGEQK